jgi:predicted RNase H-like nuclease (RuvC/YqgF family)
MSQDKYNEIALNAEKQAIMANESIKSLDRRIDIIEKIAENVGELSSELKKFTSEITLLIDLMKMSNEKENERLSREDKRQAEWISKLENEITDMKSHVIALEHRPAKSALKVVAGAFGALGTAVLAYLFGRFTGG